jgi:hypothetical protein
LAVPAAVPATLELPHKLQKSGFYVLYSQEVYIVDDETPISFAMFATLQINAFTCEVVPCVKMLRSKTCVKILRSAIKPSKYLLH